MRVITIEAFPKKSAEEVNAEFGNKILETTSEHQLHAKMMQFYLCGWVRDVQEGR